MYRVDDKNYPFIYACILEIKVTILDEGIINLLQKSISCSHDNTIVLLLAQDQIAVCKHELIRSDSLSFPEKYLSFFVNL